MLSAAALNAAEITLPEETARMVESPLPGFSLAVTHCHTCHSSDYVRYQPSTTGRATWKASVVKMQKTFGAPIPDNAIEPIAEYLVRTYGAERASPTASSGEIAPSAAPPNVAPKKPPKK